MARRKAKAPARRRPSPGARKPSPADRRRRWIAIGGVTLLLIALRLFVLEGYRISSASMEDSLLEGDVVLVERLSFGGDWLPDLSPPAPGDVVVFRLPEEGGVMIKRCVAVAGQRVQIKDKILYVDEERAADPPRSKYLDAAILTATKGPRDHFGPYVVPPGHIFVLGDNRDASQDSRFFGPVAQPMLIGRAVVVLWPRPGHGVD